jgi:single-strand DNA-binding protein
MTDTNVVILVGRMTRDAEMGYTPAGTPLVKFSLAVNETAKEGDRWKEEASFFNFAWFGKRAEATYPYMGKGQQLIVTGSLKQDRWEKNGEKKSATNVKVDGVQLVGAKKQNEGTSPPAAPQQEMFVDDIPGKDSEIPF